MTRIVPSRRVSVVVALGRISYCANFNSYTTIPKTQLPRRFHDDELRNIHCIIRSEAERLRERHLRKDQERLHRHLRKDYCVSDFGYEVF